MDLSHRGVVQVSGPYRLSWLHSLTTQSLADLPPSQPTETLVLSPHGHIEHALHVLDDGETTWLGVEPGTGAALVEWLTRMRFLLRVEVAEVSEQWAVLGVPAGVGDSSPEPLAELRYWQDPWPALGPKSPDYCGTAEAEHPGRERAWREVLVPRAELDERTAALPLAGTWAAEAARIAAWRPRLGLETDHRTIPHELDWLRTAVHLHKGCYRGQETVARVHNLGHPPRRLVFLHLDGSVHELPGHGASVVVAGKAVGVVTSAARHHELGPIALALVRRATPADVPVLVDGVAAAMEPIVTR